MRAVLRRYWPPEGQVRLLTAALADPETARQAWRQWCAENDLDAADHAEVRLLAAVAGRIGEIEPDVPLDPRLEGMRRYIWTLNQITLSATRPVLSAMHAAGVRQMLLKGAARLAADPRLAKMRAVRDIDVLIHPDDWQRACSVAIESGWRAGQGSDDHLQRLVGHAVGLSRPKRGAGGELDLHRFAIRQNKCRGQDLGMWDRARPAGFQGIELFCPSPTDQAIISLSQATWHNHRPHAAHWALDVAAFLRSGEIDWNLFRQEVHLRRIELFVAAPLLLLRERLQCPVPDDVLADLTRPIGKPYVVEFESRSSTYRPTTQQAVKAIRIVAAARAMRAARARPIPDCGVAARPDSTFQVPWLKRGATLDVPVPAGLAPVARLRMEISFQAWHAGRRSHLKATMQDLELASIPVARASRKAGGRIHYKVVLRFPAGLFSMRDATAVRISADPKLRLRDFTVRFGDPLPTGAFSRAAVAAKAWLGRLLSVRRPSAGPASP